MAMEALKNIGRSLMSEKKKSTFYQDGKLTPEEFVAAGDLLHRQCPTWEWQSGDPKKALSFLPPDKQFLLARNIPCRKRARDAANSNSLVVDSGSSSTADQDDFGFTAVAKDGAKAPAAAPAPASSSAPVEDDDSDDDVVDGDEPVPDMPMDEDNAVAKPTGESHPRIYEVSITYDKLYSSPRFWLRGVAEDGTTPLTQAQIFEDISDEHARKTVTIETHHHLNLPYASIHPCKHAHTMKMMMEMARDGAKAKREEERARREKAGESSEKDKKEEEDDSEIIPVDQYFVFFLKFIATICPTMDIDFTVAARL